MSDINRIYVNSSLTVESGYNNTLCFVDGRIIEKSRYTLENNELSLYREAVNYISVFYSANVSKTYYYEKTIDDYGIVVYGKDKIGNTLSNIRSNNIIVFVDGVLLKKTEYRVLDDSNIALLIIKNDQRFHNITIYVSNSEIKYGILSDPTNTHTKKWDPVTGKYVKTNNPENNMGYSKNNTLIFQDGKLLSPGQLKTVDGYTSTTFIPTGGIKRDVVKGDYVVDIDYGDKFEYYKFQDNTNSINFTATPGVTTYGPKDDYNVEIPLLYDSSVLFDDLVRVLIDDLRPGFMIYEKNRAGKLLIVDTDYDSRRLKTITIQEFSGQNYSKDDYYLEVPEAKNITDYLSDYDKKFTMLPEILRVFQRVLLDEIHDEIKRIKNIRNIKNVDSAHVHKLLSLLGMDLDIKHLNIKQMQEAIEELTGFYRIAGTKDSLNYFNIVQDNTKLIDIKQLFTFHKTKSKSDESDKIYSYTYSIYQNAGTIYSGTGYRPGEQYRLIGNGVDTGIAITIDDDPDAVGPNGELVEGRYRASTQEGKQAFSTVPLQLKSNSVGATLKCDSVPYIYRYTPIIESGSAGGFSVGDMLTTPLYDGIITVSSVDSQGHITGSELSKPTGTKSYSGIKNAPLQLQSTVSISQTVGDSLSDLAVNAAVFETQITSDGAHVFTYDGTNWQYHTYTVDLVNYGISFTGTPVADDELTVIHQKETTSLQLLVSAKDDSLYQVHTNTRTGNGEYTVGDSAIYEITISGAGGSGGAADTSIGSICDSPASSGYKGEEITKRIFCSAGTTIRYSIGEGGKPSYARGHDTARAGAGGTGTSNGTMGYTKIGTISPITGGWHHRHGGIRKHFHGKHWVWDAYSLWDDAAKKNNVTNGTVLVKAASGSGGGGSSFSYNGTTWTAKGGDGGSATFVSPNNQNDIVLQGGTGGNGGTKSGNGAAGGARNLDETFKSTAGANGYIIIKKVKQDYSTNSQLLHNINTNLAPGAILKTTDDWFTVTVNSVLDGRVTSFTLDPAAGVKPIFNKKSNGEILNYQKTFDLINITKTASLTLNQEVDVYRHQLTIDTNGGIYVPGQTLTDENEIFTIDITEVDKTLGGYGKIKSFTYSPIVSGDNINFDNCPLDCSHGDNALISISSSADVNIQNIEREYVDFYLPEEQGADWHKEYRFPILDYGYVNQGSPSSPWPWVPGDPDIDYGNVSEGSPNSPNPLHPGIADIDYGKVSQRIKGKWVEWMEWNRPADLYPTNHVEVEINILSVEDYEEAMSRFYKQFYNLASTVVYIHRLITVYNFGNNTTANITPENPEPSENMILLGFMTAQPFADEIYTLTSEAMDVGIRQNKNIFQHQEDFNKDYVVEHFVVDDELQIEEMCAYFNITINSALFWAKKWGIDSGDEPEPPTPPTPGSLDMGYIEENIDAIMDLGEITDPVTETQDLGNINEGE